VRRLLLPQIPVAHPAQDAPQHEDDKGYDDWADVLAVMVSPNACILAGNKSRGARTTTRVGRHRWRKCAGGYFAFARGREQDTRAYKLLE